MKLRQFMISWVLPISWRLSEQRKIKALQEFSATEFDSGWQSLYAMKYMSSPKDRADLFQHALEEISHAELFDNLCRQYSSAPMNLPVTGRQIIFKEDKDKNRILDFLCYMYVGEQSVHEDFNYYTKAKIDSKIRNTFIKIYKDEEGHAESSLEALSAFSNNDKWRLRKYLMLNRVKRAYRQFSMMSSRVGELMLSIMLSLSYLIFGIFFQKSLKKRLSMDDSSQMLLLKAQAKVFKGLTL